MARPILRICFVAILVSSTSSVVRAADAPVYQRNRDIAFVNAGHSSRGHHGGYGGYGVPFANPWFAPQAYAGTWYERPYPYHFDYYRMRYSNPPVQQIAPDCPCAEPVVQ